MEVASDHILHIVMYIWVKCIIDKEKKKWDRTWFYESVVDWMEEELNVSFHLIVRKGHGLSKLNN